jgi:signal transduction histidine kinase
MRARVITLSLLAVLAFVLGGLVLVDRMLAREDRANADADARLGAQALREYVRGHVVALAAFHGALAVGGAGIGDGAGRDDADGDGAGDRERFLGAVGTLDVAGGARGFRRVWVADSAGIVRNDYAFGVAERPTLMGWDLDTTSGFGMSQVMADARRTRRPQVSPSGELFSGARGVLVVRPIVAGDRLVGFVGGSIRGEALLAALPPAELARRAFNHITDRAGDVTAPVPTDAAIVVQHQVEVPGAAQWTFTSGYDAPNTWARLLVWAIGLSVLGVLAGTLLHERRQAIRISDRSAELERLSAELLAANRAKSEFLANISHELRTPLNAIVGFADLLRDGVYGELNARQAGPVQRIEASATHLRQLVDQILDLAKITAGRLEVHVEPIDLRPFVLDVASEVEPLINEKGLSLSIAVGATLPKVRTDPSHLRQILVNLIGNAVKYTTQGAVAVRARRVGAGERLPTRDGAGMTPPATQPPRPDGAWIALQVVDTGVGIPPDDRERIFEEFEQVNAGPRGDSQRRGTGLGLPISRRLARLLGGEVTVDSELGRGSTFTLWIPVDG